VRILQVLGSSAGGVAQHVAQISDVLVSSGHDVLVASPVSLTLKFTAITRHAAVEIADRPRAHDITVVGQLRELAKSADVVHAHGLRAAALAGFAVRSLAPRNRPRLVVTLHNLPVGSRRVQAISGVLERVVARSADLVLGVSLDLVERMAARGARVGGRALVPAPALGAPSAPRARLRSELFDETPARGTDVPLVVTIARLAPQKGLDTVVQAATLVAGEVANMRWVVAGDGPLRGELQESIDRYGAPVTLLGRRTDVADLLEAADVVVNAAVWEGQPLAVQEALRAGRAVVATDAGGTREVTGEAALLVPVSDSAELARAVTSVLTDADLRMGLEQGSRRQSETLPTADLVLESLLDAYGA